MLELLEDSFHHPGLLLIPKEKFQAQELKVLRGRKQ